MKVFFIGTVYFTIYLIYMKFKATYDSNHDSFRVEFLIVPVGGLAFLVNHEFAPLEVSMSFMWEYNFLQIVLHFKAILKATLKAKYCPMI